MELILRGLEKKKEEITNELKELQERLFDAACTQDIRHCKGRIYSLKREYEETERKIMKLHKK